MALERRTCEAFGDAGAPPPRGARTVHVVWADLSAARHELAACEALLSEAERARAARFAFAHLTERFILRRGLLRRLLSRWTGEAPERLVFSTSGHEKPILAEPGAPHFNLSDSGDLVVIALCRAFEIGIDLEGMRSLADCDALAPHCFYGAELATYRALPPQTRPHAFLQGWTSKEAMLKALGTGLYTPLDALHVELRPSRPPALLAIDGDAAPAWRLEEVWRSARHLCTIAARTGPFDIVLFEPQHTAGPA